MLKAINPPNSDISSPVGILKQQKILCVLPCEENQRGDQIFARWLNSILLERGHLVEVLAPPISAWQQPTVSWLAVGEVFQFLKISAKAMARSADVDYSIIHVPSGWVNGPGLAIFHNDIAQYAQNFYSAWHPARWRLNLLNRNFERVSGLTRKINIAVSRSQADSLTRGGVRIDHVIYHPIDVEAFSPCSDKVELRKRLGLPLEKVIVLAVGAVDRRKNWKEVVKLAKNFIDVAFLFIGPSGEQLGDLPANCYCFPHVPHAVIQDYYRASNIYLSLSYMEANSIALLEAMSSGLAICGTPVGIIPDLRNDQNVRILEASLDALSLFSDQFGKLVKDSSLQYAMGESCREFALKNLRASAIKQQYIELLAHLNL